MGKVVTFYSYKGGTGRSMMLANAAWLLASNGKTVLAIDWDLEAPGLHRYFRPFLVDPNLYDTDGLIDGFWKLVGMSWSRETKEREGLISYDNILGDGQFDVEDYVNSVMGDFRGRGKMDFIGAGRQGGSYSERVNTFDWQQFYRLGGGRFLDDMRKKFSEKYDFVFIDSRTGVSDTSGICTMQLPDAVVACFTLNRQSIDGVAAVLHSIRAWERDRVADGRGSRRKKKVELFPLVARIDNSEKIKLDSARIKAREAFEEFVPVVRGETSENYWDDMEITYRPFYAYEECLAAFGDTSGYGKSADTLLSEVESFSRRLTGISDLEMPEILEADRQRILQEYAFDLTQREGGKLNGKKKPEVEQVKTVRDDDDVEFLREMYIAERSWRESGFRYLFLLSRREIQLTTTVDKSKFGRQMAYYFANSELLMSFRSQAISVFGAMLLLYVVVGLTYLYFNWNFGGDGGEIEKRLIIANSIVLGALFIPVVVSIVLNFSPKKPYGMRTRDVFSMVIGSLRGGGSGIQERIVKKLE